MEVVLTEDVFVNGKYTVTYGVDREAVFTIVDEELAGVNTIGRVNKITIMTRTVGQEATTTRSQGAIIGLGNGVVGVTTTLPELRGKPLDKDNAGSCTIILYE